MRRLWRWARWYSVRNLSTSASPPWLRRPSRPPPQPHVARRRANRPRIVATSRAICSIARGSRPRQIGELRQPSRRAQPVSSAGTGEAVGQSLVLRGPASGSAGWLAEVSASRPPARAVARACRASGPTRSAVAPPIHTPLDPWPPVQPFRRRDPAGDYQCSAPTAIRRSHLDDRSSWPPPAAALSYAPCARRPAASPMSTLRVLGFAPLDMGPGARSATRPGAPCWHRSSRA